MKIQTIQSNLWLVYIGYKSLHIGLFQIDRELFEGIFSNLIEKYLKNWIFKEIDIEEIFVKIEDLNFEIFSELKIDQKLKIGLEDFFSQFWKNVLKIKILREFSENVSLVCKAYLLLQYYLV